jgi:hypothetical protein
MPSPDTGAAVFSYMVRVLTVKPPVSQLLSFSVKD